jgi:glycosyltransferase involved in cell wall biosynthesis
MIDIVLATFNGEQYLVEQIRSIQRNTAYEKWVNRLIIVDDGSTDATFSIVKQFCQHDKKISWLANTSNNHGPSNNFSYGLEHTESQYIMLSDQDDYWHPEKINISIQKIKQLENELVQSEEASLEKNSTSTPLLVFSDKEIVDENLQPICSSYFELKNIPKNWYQKFEQLCQQNVVSGCTVLFNRALLKKAMPIPKKAYMHDWWLAIVASKCGKIELIDKTLIKYRQHNNNNIGANQRSKLSLITRFNQHLIQFEKSFLQTVEQAKEFEIFENKHNLNKNETIKLLANIHKLTISQKLSLFINNKITRSHFVGKVALLIVLLKI